MQPAEPTEPILDEAVLAELLATTGDDPAFVRELIDTYLAEAPTQLDAVATAVDGADAAALVRPAHTLKSTSATLGAMRLSAVARRLEMAGRSGALDAGARADMGRVQEEWQAASQALTAWLAKEAGG